MTTDEGSGAAHAGQEISKSARKREAQAALRLGESLALLDPARLARIPISEALSDALRAHGGLAQREARRRQLKRIGRLLRDEDREAIAAALRQVTELTPEAQRDNRKLERWRERLLADPHALTEDALTEDALTEYVGLHPGADVQALRHLIARVRRARDPKVRADCARRLFRMLRDYADAARADAGE